jgi:ABC-2 type transport system permease protein
LIRILGSIALKDLRLLARDRTGAFLAVAWPLVVAVFFGSMAPLSELLADPEVRGPRNPYTVTFTQGIVWAVMACTANFGVSLVQERQQGTLLRLCAAPIGRGHVLAGKSLACLVSILVVGVCLMAIAVALFGVRPQSWALWALSLLGVAIGFSGVMMLMAVLGRTAQSAAGLTWAVLMAFAMLGGAMLPSFMMPVWLQKLALASPVSWALLAMEGAIWRGWTLLEVLRPLGALLALSGACFAIGTRSFRDH